MSNEVKVAIGLDINGQRLMLDEDTARSLYLKLKELFNREYQGPFFTYTIPYYPQYTITSSSDYTVPSTNLTSICTNKVAGDVSLV